MDASPKTPVYYTPILLKLARSIKTSETSPFSGSVASGGITGRNLDSGQTDALPARRKSLPPIDEDSLFEIDAKRTVGAKKSYEDTQRRTLREAKPHGQQALGPPARRTQPMVVRVWRRTARGISPSRSNPSGKLYISYK
jgi:hypothetical protein